MTLDETFSPVGPLASLAGYQHREPQVVYAQRVSEAIESQRPALLEGPTGSGKSFGYLVPAIAHAVAEGLTVLVVVPTKSLQDQIAGKDLPDLQSVLPHPFAFAVLKGRSSYGCLSRIHGLPGGRKWKPLRQWADETEVGEIASSPLEPHQYPFATITADDCPGAPKCSYGSDCFAEQARARARDAQVVVVNSALFALGLRLGVTSSTWTVIPQPDVVIFDEAHRIADALRERWGTRLTERSLVALADLLPESDEAAGVRLAREAELFFSAISEWAERQAVSLVTEPVPVDPKRLVAALRTVADLMREHAGRLEGDERARARRRSEVISTRIEDLTDWLGVASEDRFYSLESGRYPALVSKWLEVGPELQGLLEEAEVRSQIYTSATLRTSGTFDWVRRDLALELPIGHVAPSPFSDEQALRYVLPVEPDHHDPARWNEEAARAVRALVSASGGGALLLCTARARMQLMRDALDGLGLRVLVHQSGADLGSLVADFRDDPDSVLIASRGAFEGVDVRGESLRLVVLDRLPFPHLDDPIIAALGRIGRGWGDESLPRAVMAARQAFGRLIRSTDDRGVIALLDGRALTRSYGAEFVQEPFTTNLADVEAFFADGAAA